MKNDALQDLFAVDPEIIYLNHAAVAPWPVPVQEAVCRFARENAHAGSRHYPRWLATEQRLRERAARLLGVEGTDGIALVKNTSEGLSFVAHGLDWQAGDEVVIPAGEFPSNRIVWESLAPRGVVVREVPLDFAQPEAALMAACGPATRLMSVSAVQYASGLRLDLDRLGTFCREHDILFCIDAIQWLGALPFDAVAARADFVVADGHKWLLAPEGLGLFFCREALLDRLKLHEYGWHMVAHPGEFDRRDWAPAASARRFECGSPNMLGVHALDAALGLLLEIGLDRVAARIAERTDRLVAALADGDRFRLLSPASRERRAGIVTFAPLRETPEALFQRLQAAGVQCALRGGGVRLSPHFHTPMAQIERVLALLEEGPASQN